MKEETKKTKKFNKKYLMFGLPILCLALVAAFVVSTLTLNVGVAEPFEVEYGILGDGGTYEVGVDTCENDATYFALVDFPIAQGLESDTMLPGQSRFVCVKIENEAGIIPYEITADVIGGAGLCKDAFGEYTVTGDAVASDGAIDGITYDGFEVIVATDAAPVTGCMVTIDVARV